MIPGHVHDFDKSPVLNDVIHSAVTFDASAAHRKNWWNVYKKETYINQKRPRFIRRCQKRPMLMKKRPIFINRDLQMT